MEWIIAIIVLAIMLGCVVFFASKLQKKSGRVSRPDVAELDRITISPPTKETRPRLSAAEMLSRVQRLRDQSAQWDVVWSALNPTDDPEVQRLLSSMTTVLKAVLMLMFLYIAKVMMDTAIGRSEGLGIQFLPVFLAATFLPLILYSRKLRRLPK